MRPLPVARRESGMGTIVVDMGLKSNGAMGVDVYSPNKKTARPEPVSRIHCIPLLMIFVFFILWARSSEILPGAKVSEDAEMFVMRLPAPNKFAASEQLKAFNDEVSQHGTRTVLFNRDHEPHSKHSLSEKTYMRGNTR